MVNRIDQGGSGGVGGQLEAGDSSRKDDKGEVGEERGGEGERAPCIILFYFLLENIPFPLIRNSYFL